MKKFVIAWIILMAILLFLPSIAKADNIRMAYDTTTQQWVSICFVTGKKDSIEICKTKKDVTERVEMQNSSTQQFFIIKEQRI